MFLQIGLFVMFFTWWAFDFDSTVLVLNEYIPETTEEENWLLINNKFNFD